MAQAGPEKAGRQRELRAKRRRKSHGYKMKFLLIVLSRAGQENIWLSLMM